jgi:hypothetical protein
MNYFNNFKEYITLLKKKLKTTKKICFTPLIYSIIHSLFDSVKYLIEELKADLFTTDSLNKFNSIEYGILFNNDKNNNILKYLFEMLHNAWNNNLNFKINYDIKINYNK